MIIAKNDEIKLHIDALTSQGSGIGRYDGIAVFVRGTAPGDDIVAHIIKASKNYAVGIVKEIINPSTDRIESDCPVSDRCGGCSFRSVSYDAEIKYKKNRVEEAFKRIGGLDISVEEIIAADSTERYRNKAQYPVEIGKNGFCTGFYSYKSHRIVPCRDCLLQPSEFKDGISAFEAWAEQAKVSSFDELSGSGILRHIYFRKAVATGEIAACAVVSRENIPKPELLVSLLREKVSGLKSVALNINPKKTNVILGEKTKIIWGSETITDEFLGKKIVISPNSFCQVNHNQCEKLYLKAREYAGLTGEETLLDLYCGAGSIGLTMADGVKQLIGIEIIPQAIENAKVNAEINGVSNAEFICADAFEGAKILKNRGITPDIVILDPPRKGCSADLLETVCNMNPGRIVYVSCDCSTLARDAKLLSSIGYKVEKLSAVDMFPRTPHVETVVLMSRKDK